MTTPYDTDLDRNRGEFPAADAAVLSGARRPRFIRTRTAIDPRRARPGIIGSFTRAPGNSLRRWRAAASSAAIPSSVMLANTPAMVEAHYGVPMAGAVLNTLNTRLDAAILGFTLDHGETKVLIVDREFSKVMKDALARAKVKPLVIDYDDPEFTGAGERIGSLEYEEFLREGDPDFAWLMPARRMGRDFAQLYLGHHRRSQGRGLSSPRRLSAGARQRRHLRHGQASGLSVDAADVSLQRLVLHLDAVGRRRHPCLPARGARGADLRRHRHAQGHASVRRADRDVDAAQRAGAGEEAAAACRRSSPPRPRRRRKRCWRR